MPNNYYERFSEMNPGELADGLAIEQEFDAIGRGFSKLPAPHRDGSGFEGPTRVGDPVEKTDAVNLGTLEKLNLPIYREKITTEDWNTITDAGIYDVANANGANKAPGYAYGVLVVHVFNGVATQLFYPDKNCILIKRVCQSISTQVWTEWDASYSSSMGAAGFRNKVINGDFRVNQRSYASGAATVANQYTLDRWKVSGPGGIAFATVNGKTTVTIPSGQTLRQVIEGINVQPGDYVLSWGGTSLGRINGGEYGASGHVIASLVGGSDVTVEFSSGSVDSVQLEVGGLKSPFETRHYGYEFELCQRYCRYIEGGFSISHYPIYGNARWNSQCHEINMMSSPTILRSSCSGQTDMRRGGVASSFAQEINGASGNIRVQVSSISKYYMVLSMGGSAQSPDSGSYAYCNYSALLESEL